MEKPWYTSFTIWGGALIAVAQFLETSGVTVPGTSVALSTLVSALGTLLATYGVRKKLGEVGQS